MTDIPAVSAAAPNRLLNAGLWGAQILLLLAFGSAGWMKLTVPIPELAPMLPWTGQVSESFVRFIGAVDLAGGLGILLPSLLRIKPGLTLLAASGCIALQICAMIFHVSRGESIALPLNLVLLLLAAFVFWGRRKLPIQAR